MPRFYGNYSKKGPVFGSPEEPSDLRKEEGAKRLGDGWYNTAPGVARLCRSGENLVAFFSALFIATFKLDGFQTGVTIAKDDTNTPYVEAFWSRNRELSSDESAGKKKIGNAGQMGGAYDAFKAFALCISTDIFQRDENIAKVTVSGEGYRASHGKQSAKFASIHPFQLILELIDGTEIVLLMTPALHEFFLRHGTSQKSFRDAVDMNQFLLTETQCHVFPVPILHIGNLHECIRAGYNLAMNVSESYVEGIMISLVTNPNFVMKLKTPQQMKGEFSSIKRLAPLNTPSNDSSDLLTIFDPEIRESYQLLVDIYDAFLLMTENVKKDAKLSTEASDIDDTLKSMIPSAFQKFTISDVPKPDSFDIDSTGFFTQPLSKADFFPFLAKTKDFMLKEISKNYLETSGQDIDRNISKNLSKMIQDFLSVTFCAPK